MTVLLLWAAFAAAGPRQPYLREHREWTRELSIYRQFATALVMRATLLEPSFRQDLAAERARLLRPSPEDHAEFLARMERDGAAYHDVVFAADSVYDNERFGAADDRWNVRLIVDGVQASLVSVEQIRRPSPLHEALYPQLDLWSSLWVARWDRVAADPARVELIVGSGYGNGSLLWERR